MNSLSLELAINELKRPGWRDSLGIEICYMYVPGPSVNQPSSNNHRRSIMFPSLDFSRFHDPSQREAFCREFVTVSKESGFVKLVNHGIPSGQIDQAFAAVCFHSPSHRCAYTYLV